MPRKSESEREWTINVARDDQPGAPKKVYLEEAEGERDVPVRHCTPTFSRPRQQKPLLEMTSTDVSPMARLTVPCGGTRAPTRRARARTVPLFQFHGWPAVDSSWCTPNECWDCPWRGGDEHKESWFSLGTHELLIRREPSLERTRPCRSHDSLVIANRCKIDRFHLPFPRPTFRPRGHPCGHARGARLTRRYVRHVSRTQTKVSLQRGSYLPARCRLRHRSSFEERRGKRVGNDRGAEELGRELELRLDARTRSQRCLSYTKWISKSHLTRLSLARDETAQRFEWAVPRVSATLLMALRCSRGES